MTTRKIALALSLLAFSGGAHAFGPVNDFNQAKSNPGNLKMYMHVPATLKDPAPLVLALHGCTQSATAYHNESGWTQLADTHGFYVVYPEQNTENKANQTGNPFSCFNWAGYYGAKMKKGEGENASIKQMVEYMQERYNIDSSRIYITGLSAGGGLTTMMLALYPDVFAGGAPMAGLPYHCATTVDEAYACMGVTSSFQPRTGPGCETGEACMDPKLKKTPEQWGNLARANNGNWQGAYPRVIIWQGDKDQYVDDDNAIEIMKQFTNLHGTDQTSERDGKRFNSSTKHAYREYDLNGKPVVAVADLFGMKHGIAVDPGNGEDQGGKPGLAMSYTHDWDVHSTYYTAKWWGLLDEAGGGNIAPLVIIKNPKNGEHLSGQVTVNADVADDDGIAKVEFFLNGQLLSVDTSYPYSASFNADTLADGNHTVKVVATDAHGEDPKSGEASVSFSTGNDAPVVSFTSPKDGAKLSGNVAFTVNASDRDGIAYVDFILDGQVLSRVSAAPFTVNVDTSALADGKHTMKAVAVDNSAKEMKSEAQIGFETGKPQVACQQWTTFNMYHALSGRARNVSLLWWAPDYRVVGSNEALGSSGFLQTTIRTTETAGSYALGACPTSN